MIEFEVATGPTPVCGIKRSKKGTVYCELPPDHNVKSMKYTYHTGRTKTGSWITWKVEVEQNKNG